VAVAVAVAAAAVVVAVVVAVGEEAVAGPAWGVEAVAEVVLRRPEQERAAAGQSPGGPWGARPSPRSPALIAQGPALPAGAHRAAVAPRSGAPSGPVARFSSVAVAAGVVAEVE